MAIKRPVRIFMTFLLGVILFIGGLGYLPELTVVAGGTLAIFLLLLAFLKRKEISLPYGFWIYGLFLFFFSLSLLWSLDWWKSLSSLALFVSGGVFWVAFFNLKGKSDDLVEKIVLVLTKSLPLSILTAVFYGASRVIVDSTSYATTEGLFLFLFNLGILFMIVILSKKVSSKWLLVAFALVSALCNQTKLNGVLLVFMFNVLVIFTKVLRPNYGERVKKWLFNIFLVNLLFVLFYIGLNPSLYKNPLRNLNFQYSWTYKVAQFLQNISPSEERLDTPVERVRFIFKAFFEKQGLLPSFVGRDQGGWINLLATPFLLVFFVAGFSRLAAKTVDESRRLFKNVKSNFSNQVVFFLIFLLIFFSTSLYLLLAWERYLIHLILPVWLIIFYGLIFASSFLLAKAKRNSFTKIIPSHLKKF